MPRYGPLLLGSCLFSFGAGVALLGGYFLLMGDRAAGRHAGGPARTMMDHTMGRGSGSLERTVGNVSIIMGAVLMFMGVLRGCVEIFKSFNSGYPSQPNNSGNQPRNNRQDDIKTPVNAEEKRKRRPQDVEMMYDDLMMVF